MIRFPHTQPAMDLSDLLYDSDMEGLTVVRTKIVRLAESTEEVDPTGSATELVGVTTEASPAGTTPLKKKTPICLRKRGETARDLYERNLDTFQDPDVPGLSLPETITSIPAEIVDLGEEELEEEEAGTALQPRKRKKTAEEGRSAKKRPMQSPQHSSGDADEQVSPTPATSSRQEEPSVFIPRWSVGVDSTWEDPEVVVDFLQNVRPPKMVEALAVVTDEDCSSHAKKAFFDHLMWQVEQRSRLQATLNKARSHQRNNTNLNRLLKDSEADVERLKREVAVEKDSRQKAEQDFARLAHLNEQQGREISSLQTQVQDLQASLSIARDEINAAMGCMATALAGIR